MRHSALPLAKSKTALSLAEIERNVEGWLLDGEIRQHSKTTLANRRLLLDKLLEAWPKSPAATKRSIKRRVRMP